MLETDGRVLVTGAGGFIGGHLVRALVARGFHDVRAVDLKPVAEWFQVHPAADARVADLRVPEDADAAVEGCTVVVNLASDMGGMGFIERNKALCMRSVLINTHLLDAALRHGVVQYFYSSSACVYPAQLQADAEVIALREEDAYPAMPEDGYGWEKLFSERLCHHYTEEFGLPTRVARYHNVYGPNGTWDGGREKAPSAICRKVAEAVLTGSGEIEIWGDGDQTRSFTYIDDCLEGTLRLLASDVTEPVNIGSSELVTINGLVDRVEAIAGTTLRRRYVLDAPLGVRGRNSDNTLVRKVLDWEPSTTLAEGLEPTYRWVYDQVARAAR